jgi:hypothetical protein
VQVELVSKIQETCSHFRQSEIVQNDGTELLPNLKWGIFGIEVIDLSQLKSYVEWVKTS